MDLPGCTLKAYNVGMKRFVRGCLLAGLLVGWYIAPDEVVEIYNKADAAGLVSKILECLY